MSSQDRPDDQISLLELLGRVRAAKRRGDEAEHLRLALEFQRVHSEHHRKRDAEKARRRGRKPLDAAAIAAAGVAIADAQGFEEVSMRKIAAVLGWGTMSLYHYVRTKEDLLAAMEDIVMGEILVPPSVLNSGWHKGLAAIARATREAYRRHPWALGIQTNGGQPGVNGLRHVEQSLAALAPTNLSFHDKLAMTIVIDDYVFGHALRAIEGDSMQEGGKDMLDSVVDFVSGHMNAADFPQMTAAIGDGTVAEFVGKMSLAFHPDEWFEVGLEAVLAGLAQRFGLAP